MTKQEKKIISLARQWWKNHRPWLFNKEDHLKHPKVNCKTETEGKLAIAVSKYEKTQTTKEPTRRKRKVQKLCRSNGQEKKEKYAKIC